MFFAELHIQKHTLMLGTTSMCWTPPVLLWSRLSFSAVHRLFMIQGVSCFAVDFSFSACINAVNPANCYTLLWSHMLRLILQSEDCRLRHRSLRLIKELKHTQELDVCLTSTTHLKWFTPPSFAFCFRDFIWGWSGCRCSTFITSLMVHRLLWSSAWLVLGWV